MSLSVSIVVPVYCRTRELSELLDSVLKLELAPQEVILCEDCSPERLEIRALVDSFKEKFAGYNVPLIYIENEHNLGFDANLRKCIELARSDWALVLGNDDLLLPNALSELFSFIDKNSQVKIVSRTFIRFVDDIEMPIGISSLSEHDVVYAAGNSSSKFVFRTCGFIGGLAIHSEFARSHSTTKFDGGLYYQISLACHAFCTGGIGYIATPIAGGRADNPPLFGMSTNESAVHVPGGYTAKGRAKMWASVLTIARDIGSQYGIDLLSGIRSELMVRQSFHIFEMNAGNNSCELKQLKSELTVLGLFSHWLPKTLYFINVLFGKNSKLFYKIVRKVLQ
jgi:abequosyltransferase